jgi:putative sigma-54 modulation protein
MNLVVTGRNLEVRDPIKEFVGQKVGKLERYLPGLTDVRTELSVNKTRSAQDHFTCQITTWSSGRILRAEESHGDIHTAVTGAVDKLSRQIEKVKGRRKHTGRKSLAMNIVATLEPAAMLDEPALHAPADVYEDFEQIVRRKQFVVQTMTEEDAIDQMELLSHDFFLFHDSIANALHLIYRRKDGHYGVLEPQLAEEIA